MLQEKKKLESKPECERDDSLPCDQLVYDCDDCKSPCPDERALRNIKACFESITNGSCPSDCKNCKYEFRWREP